MVPQKYQYRSKLGYVSNDQPPKYGTGHETNFFPDWIKTTLYTRLLINFTKRTKKAPILRCTFLHQYLDFLKLAHYTQSPFKM